MDLAKSPPRPAFTVAYTLFLLLLLASGCRAASELSGPSFTVQRFDGIEQVIELVGESAQQPNDRWLHLTSRLVNRGADPVTLRVRGRCIMDAACP